MNTLAQIPSHNSRADPLHRVVVDAAEVVLRVVVVCPGQLELAARDCQVRLTSLGHAGEPAGLGISAAGVNRRGRAVFADLHQGRVIPGQLRRTPNQRV